MPTIHGILLLDKPTGLSSNQALQRAKRLLGADKAGHTGSLDPLATGMLPLVFGEATKVAGHLLGSRKAYAAEVALGATTTTDDSEGEVVATAPVPEFDEARLAHELVRLTGTILQRPPAYSALKRAGVPLYKLARKGLTLEIPEREVRVDAIVVLNRTATHLRLEVTCGSGTYIRSLARDLGAALGCGAHLSALRRLWVEPFEHVPMHGLTDLEVAVRDGRSQELLLPPEAGLDRMPRLDADLAEAERIRQGRVLQRPGLDWQGACCILGPDGRLLALAERDEAGTVRPVRVLNP
jgi:tRNA pseudouridine55 synthase